MTSSIPDFHTRNFKLGAMSFPEKVIYWVIVLTPLWWLLGIQTLFYPAVVVGLLAVNFDIDKLTRVSIPACIWAWLGMAIVMVWTATFGLDDVGFAFQRIAATFVTFFKSYCLIVTALLLPFWHEIRVKVVTRAVAWMATGYLVTIAIEMVMLAVGLGKEPFLPPLARLIPGGALSLLVTFADLQPFFGIPLPRTVLYTPDPPIVGVCSILSFFICLGEENRRLRQISVAGCLTALLISFSRLSWVSFVIALVITACFRSSLARQGSLWIGSLSSLLCALLGGLTLSDLVKKPLEIFNSARAESSKDRELVVTKTLEAWQQRPWMGWGIIQGSVKWYIYDIVLGSFSTYASVLYLHGIIGFIFFLAALGSTLWSTWTPAIRGNHHCQWAFASLVALYMLLNGTPLTWMAVYLWYFWVWLGAIIAEIQRNEQCVSRWQQLADRT